MEGVENFRKLLGPNADAGVLNRHFDTVPVASPADVERDLSLIRKFEGIGEQVRQNLPDLAVIAFNQGSFPLDLVSNRNAAFLDERPNSRNHLHDQRAEVHLRALDRHLSRRDLRQIEDVIYQPDEVVRVSLDPLQRLPLRRDHRPIDFVLKKRAVSDDRVDRGSKLMGNIGDELRFEPVCLFRLGRPLFQGLVRLLQLLGPLDHPIFELLVQLTDLIFRLFLLRLIARDLGKTDDLSLLVLNSGDQHTGPKLRAVFSDAPSLFFKPPLFGGDSQLIPRLVPYPVPFRIEDGKVLSNDLFFPITFQPLRSRVPALNDPFTTEHEDGIIPDPFHQQAKALLRPLSLRQIPRNLGEADHPSPLLQPGDHDIGPESRAVLSNAPSFILKPALFQSAPEITLRLSVASIGLGIKGREVRPDNLVGPILLDPLRPEVPALHISFQIEEEDRIIFRFLNQQPVVVELGGKGFHVMRLLHVIRSPRPLLKCRRQGRFVFSYPQGIENRIKMNPILEKNFNILPPLKYRG